MTNKLSETEKLLYQIMGAINRSNLPIIFKGALVLKLAKSDHYIARETMDIDCDWINSAPISVEIEKELNEAVRKTLPDVSFKLIREYGEGRSAGFQIYQNGIKISSMDMSIRSLSSSKEYYIGESEFIGYDLHNIVADKTVVLSSDRVFRRIKDFIDIYCICLGDDIDIDEVYRIIEEKGRKMGDFNAVFNRKTEIEHAYEEIRRIEPKPDLENVYEVIKRYCEAFKNSQKELEWKHRSMKWEKKQN